MGTSATTTAYELGTAVQSFMGTLTDVSLDFMTQSALITGLVIAFFIFTVLYWLRGKLF